MDSVVELLKHAKEALNHSLYSTILLWNLQPRYATAVLTLKTGDRLKDPAAVEWPYIVQYMAQYERTQLYTEASTGSDSHRTMPLFAGKSQGSVPDISKIDCYYCKELGHYAADCPALKAKEKRNQERGRRQKAQQAKKAKPRDRSRSPSSGSGQSGTEGEGQPAHSSKSKPPSQRLHVVRTLNRFAALTDSDDDEAERPAESKLIQTQVEI